MSHTFTRIVSALLVISGLLACTGLEAKPSETMQQYRYVDSDQGYSLELQKVPTPAPGALDVLIRVRATSLNSRDLSIYSKSYGPGNANGSIPLSDGAGEVIAIGKDVSRFKVGDRVAGTFFTTWIEGERTLTDIRSARGQVVNGMLAEVIVANQESLVSIPEHLSYEEAATLPCAAVTAWNGLFKHGNLKRDEFVLLEGTGGVSSFGLLFSAAAGAKPIITSSSNDKLARARELGAFGTVNYREVEEWQKTVRELTSGAGVDHVLEVGGEKTLAKAMQAMAFDSHIALIGRLTGAGPAIPFGSLVRTGATATGIYVGSRADFEAMNEFIIKHKIHPVIDRVFTFDQAPEAFEFMRTGSYMGKIVISH